MSEETFILEVRGKGKLNRGFKTLSRHEFEDEAAYASRSVPQAKVWRIVRETRLLEVVKAQEVPHDC